MSAYSKQLQIKETKEQRKIRKLQEKLTRVKEKKGQPKISDLKKKLQRVVNAYVRIRDKDLPCISCQKNVIEDAGHYIAQGANGALRFNLENIHGQCRACNVWKRGNLIEYRINLVKKIGMERVEALESRIHEIKKWQREELLQLLDQILFLTKNHR